MIAITAFIFFKKMYVASDKEESYCTAFLSLIDYILFIIYSIAFQQGLFKDQFMLCF